MKSRLWSVLGVSALLVASFGGPALAATASSDCVPSDGTPAYDDPPITTLVPDTYIEHDAVAAVTDRVNYVWTGGPSETAPAINADGWHANSGAHNGNPFNQPDG